MKKLTLTLVFLAILLTACTGTATPTPAAEPTPATESTPNAVTAEGKLLPAPAVELAFAQGGVIAEVPVKPGDKVAAGDVLARLVGIETVQAELAAAQLELVSAQQALDDLLRSRDTDLAQAERNLANAKQAVEDAQKDVTKLEYRRASDDLLKQTQDEIDLAKKRVSRAEDAFNLVKNRPDGDSLKAEAELALVKARIYRDNRIALLNWYLGKPSDIDAAKYRAALNLALAQEADVQREYDHLKNGPDGDKLSLLEARLNAAKATVTAAEAALKVYELRAPFSGTLLSLDVAIGESVTPMLPFAFLADTSHWTVETKDLAEIDIARVALGQTVIVKFDAFPGEEFTAKVTAIDPVGQEYLGDMTYKVTVTLNEADSRFMWNMTATISIGTEGK